MNISRDVISRLSDVELDELQEAVKNEIEIRKESQVELIATKIKELSESIGLSPKELMERMYGVIEPKPNVQQKRVLVEDDPKPTSAHHLKAVLGSVNKAMYKDPDNEENTWTGRGKRPNWLKKKLEEGYELKQFKA